MKKPLSFLIALLLTACTLPQPVPPPAPPDSTRLPASSGDTSLAPSAGTTATPFQPVFPTPILSPTPSPTPETITIWAPAALDLELPPEFTRTAGPESALLRLTPDNNPENAFTSRTYSLAAPFPTLTDSTTSTDMKNRWFAESSGLLVSPETAELLTLVWGAPGNGVEIVDASRLLEEAWNTGLHAVLPFDQLGPKWKVIAVDGQSPLQKEFNPDDDPLTFSFHLAGPDGLAADVIALYGPGTAREMTRPTNRDPEQLTTLVMTGVTALVRATAFAMEQQGVLYPARDIGDWLRSADILHISNEVPFAQDCPYPNPVQAGVVFCSDPKYIRLLEDIGTDVVELTGDHFHDWGDSAMRYTLDLYADRSWPVYGGGENFEEGKQAAFMEHNGNRFAFIGCNGKGGGFAQASATRPGSVRCDFDWLTAEIRRLTDAGYLVIGTFQHFEYYTYAAPATMYPDFRALADAGAVIVSGSQAHHPHGFEFREDSLIHYGLGNLFFDQLGISPGTEQAFIDRHVFYEGRYLGVELLTIRFEDFARSRPMTSSEREALLRNVFSASGW